MQQVEARLMKLQENPRLGRRSPVKDIPEVVESEDEEFEPPQWQLNQEPVYYHFPTQTYFDTAVALS